MIVLGLDPGLAIVGFGVIKVEGGRYIPIDYGVITTPKEMTTANRLISIGDQLTQLITKYNPDEIALEELFFYNNAKTVITVAEARGILLYICTKSGAKLSEYTPLQVKQAITGYGNADKKQMQQMVRILLKLTTTPKPDDAADALAIALCHIQSRRVNAYK